MWPVYSGNQYRDALAQWDAGQPDPEDRRALLDAEALVVADVVTAEQHALDRPLPVLILVGAGGNGRAGLRAGTELLRRGYRVEVALFPRPRPEDAPGIYPDDYRDPEALWRADATDEARDLLRVFLAGDGQITRRRGNDDVWSRCLGVDALCGRGTDGPLRGPATAWASFFVNNPPVVAVDQPTGPDPDTGRTVPAPEDAAPAVGGFTAENTVVVGGLRPVHLLNPGCGRLIYVSGGLHGLLSTAETVRCNEADAADPDYFDTHGCVPVRTRRGYLARDRRPATALPTFTAYADPWSDADRTENPRARTSLQIPGTFTGLTADRPLTEWACTTPAPPWHPDHRRAVGIAGRPARRPGAPELVAAGATALAGWDIVADRAAADRVTVAAPEAEVVATADPDRVWVQCAAETAVDLSGVPTVVLTRDAVRDLVAVGRRLPGPPEGQQTLLVVDRDTARDALRAWGRDTDRGSPVTLAEELASCTGAEVILVDTVIVQVRDFSTEIIAADRPLQGFTEVLAGVLAADLTRRPDLDGLLARLVLARTTGHTAREVARELPDTWRDLLTAADAADAALPR
ncbi:NAD(P)H-hydrate epimerase [Corynebacterium nuruki]|uniref:NAD(P)H-hydrate epimerase n=1 Tax=Corynebacterium nuruki TaxID=1032851 RepID=UPI0039BFE91A